MSLRRYNLPPLNALKAFETFGRYLNLRDAAEELCVTESAVSRQLRQLEDYLQVKLLERVGRNSQLTDVGQHYLTALTQGFSCISDATDSLFPPPQRAGKKTILKLGVGPVFAEYWLSKHLGEFKKLHPSIELEIHVNHNLLLEAPLERVDVEIYTGNSTHTQFLCDPLFRIHDFAVCSPALLAQVGEVHSVDDLLQFPLLHEGSTHWWTAWFASAGSQQAVDSSGTIVYDQIQCVKLALAGEGIAMGDHICTSDYIKSGELVRPITDKVITKHWVSLLIKPEKMSLPAVAAFRQWLLAAMVDFKSGLADYSE